MGDVVNLRRARKDAARRVKEAAAASTRATAYGVSKVARDDATRKREREERRHDAHRLDTPDPNATGASDDRP